MWNQLVDVYKRSLKPKDFFVNNYVFRPLAACVVLCLRNTPITPNQVTFLSLFLALLGHFFFATVFSFGGLVLGVAFVLLSFVFDSVDGQLARIRNSSSVIGGFLDFLMDEIKAVFLVTSLGYRLFYQNQLNNRWVAVLYFFGPAIVASGVALTTFIRRPEYAHHQSINPSFQTMPPFVIPTDRPKNFLEKLILLANECGRHFIHYPEWIWIPLLIFARVDYFLTPYLVAHLIYLGKTALSVLYRLARFNKPNSSNLKN